MISLSPNFNIFETCAKDRKPVTHYTDRNGI